MSRAVVVLLIVVAAIVIAFVCGCAKRSKSTRADVGSTRRGGSKELPALDEVKYISGRAAELADGESGVAAFVQEVDGASVGTPCDIQIPQYAIHTDEKGKQVAGIIIQAEHSPDLNKDIYAMQTADGSDTIGLSEEFTLLGDKRPD